MPLILLHVLILNGICTRTLSGERRWSCSWRVCCYHLAEYMLYIWSLLLPLPASAASAAPAIPVACFYFCLTACIRRKAMSSPDRSQFRGKQCCPSLFPDLSEEEWLRAEEKLKLRQLARHSTKNSQPHLPPLVYNTSHQRMLIYIITSKNKAKKKNFIYPQLFSKPPNTQVSTLFFLCKKKFFLGGGRWRLTS